MKTSLFRRSTIACACAIQALPTTVTRAAHRAEGAVRHAAKPAVTSSMPVPLMTLLAAAPERIVFAQFVDVRMDMLGLTFEKTCDRVRERRVREPVRGVRDGRQEAARELVFALCAAFERIESGLDAEFEQLVVGRFEMQAGHVFERAPIAAIQRAAAVSPRR